MEKELQKNTCGCARQSPSVSAAEFVQILRMENVNGAGRLFGGDLIAWMDDVSAISARRYAHCPVTTACIESLRFVRPAYQNESMVVTGRVVWTGRTSMEVLVRAEVERFTGERDLIADGRFILVALDENEHPCPVPPLLPETDEERRLYEEAAARHAKKITK
ncbi:MAG: acyl-CoA thioesterase [Clostridia bacterium]|nr:acyl-CoA thioesterase [Clostridia bacterium]MBQ9774258.1 acyl-CoA thioesterase [Clostridia bacterium]